MKLGCFVKKHLDDKSIYQQLMTHGLGKSSGSYKADWHYKDEELKVAHYVDAIITG